MPPKSVIDIDGTDAVSKVLLDLLNQFPGTVRADEPFFYAF